MNHETMKLFQIAKASPEALADRLLLFKADSRLQSKHHKDLIAYIETLTSELSTLRERVAGADIAMEQTSKYGLEGVKDLIQEVQNLRIFFTSNPRARKRWSLRRNRGQTKDSVPQKRGV